MVLVAFIYVLVSDNRYLIAICIFVLQSKVAITVLELLELVGGVLSNVLSEAFILS